MCTLTQAENVISTFKYNVVVTLVIKPDPPFSDDGAGV